MTEENGSAKRGRGRPKGDGHSGEMLLRHTVALEAYQQARGKGEKHEIALEVAADAVRVLWPKKKCSLTQIKDILARWMPAHERHESLLVTRSSSPPMPEVPGSNPAVSGNRTMYAFGFGDRPKYPRANAASKNEKK